MANPNNAVLYVAAVVCCVMTAAGGYDVNEILADYEESYAAEALASWNIDVEGEEADVEAVTAPYKYLYTDKDLLEYFKGEEVNATDVKTAAELGLLYATLAEGYVYGKTEEIDLQLDELDRTAHFYVPGLEEPVALRDYGRFFFAAEPDPAILENLRCAKANYIINTVNPLRKKKSDLKTEAARDLGYDNYADFYFSAYGLNIETERTRATEFLDDTNDIFRDVADRRCSAILGVPAADVGRDQKRAIYFAREYDR
jgi:hypothetical protein